MTSSFTDDFKSLENLELPSSGKILGLIANELRILDGTLRNGTANRFFRGELVGEKVRRQIARDLAKAIDQAGLLPQMPVVENARSKGKDPSVLLAFFILNRARDWDAQRAKLGMWGMKFRRPGVVVASLIRWVVADLSIRIGIYLHAAGVRIEHDRFDWLKPEARKVIFTQNLTELTRKRLTLDELAERSGLSENTIDSWLYNGVRPREENLAELCEVLASYNTDKSADQIRSEINIKLAVARLVYALANMLGTEVAEDIALHGLRFCSLISTKAHHVLRSENSDQKQIRGLQNSFGEQPTLPVQLTNLLIAREQKWIWRILLLGMNSKPGQFWQLVSILAGSEDAMNKLKKWVNEGKEVSEEALELASDDLIGDISRSVADMASVNRDLNKYEAGSPGFKETLTLIMADVNELLDAPDRSVASIQSLVNSEPSSAFLHWRLGVACAAASDPERALQELWIATELDPKWETAWVELAVGHLMVDDLGGACNVLSKAVDNVENPGADLYFILGGTEFSRMNYALAMDHLKRCIALRPVFGPAYELLATCAARLGSRREAWIYAREAYKYGLTDNLNLSGSV